MFDVGIEVKHWWNPHIIILLPDIGSLQERSTIIGVLSPGSAGFQPQLLLEFGFEPGLDVNFNTKWFG